MFTSLLSRLAEATPKHPLPMRTMFRDCFLVNFAMAPETLKRILPPPLTPDLFDGEAYLSVVIADMERMRPAFLPAVCGITYQQVVYRAIVRHGERRGVHFLRSDADHPLMVVMGNLLSFFRFHNASITRTTGGGLHSFDLVAGRDEPADIHATFDVGRARGGITPGSAFPSMVEAQRFLVELYTAYRPAPDGRRVSSVDIERGAWNIRMVEATRACFDWMNGSSLFPAGSTRLDSVIYVEDVPYYWHTVKHEPA